MDVVVVPGSSDHRQWRRNGSSGHHVVAQLLESPLPTPRRSCCGRGHDDASPQRRGHVPFKWESSPGVPKSAAADTEVLGKPEREVLPVQVPPPKPPPGRLCCGTCHARRHHGNATTGSSSSSSSDDDGTFSDALDRVSSSDRLAALSARLSAIDGGGGVFGSSRSRRSPSFIMDRFLPAANAIATSSADKHHPRRPLPRRSSKSKRDRDAEAAARARLVAHIRRRALAFEQPKRQHSPCKDAAKEEAEGEEMTPRACGFMFFVPWSAKPVLLGFQRSPTRARSQTPRAADFAASVTTTASVSSPPRRSVTLGDVLEKDCRRLRVRDGGLSHWYDDDDDDDGERSGSGKEWANPGWGMALLGTSRRYCADARKALMSRLTRSGVDGDSPRIGGGRERSSGKHKQKQVAASMSMLRSSTSVKMPPLSPPSESWLSNARRSNAAMRE